MKRIILFAYIILVSSSLYADTEKNVLWNNEKSAIAFCVSEPESRCFIVVDESAIDVSQVENANIGKLGIAPKEKYERVITFPAKWLRSKTNEYMVSFTTKAWLSGQRHTVTEPVLVKNGKYTVR